MPTVRFAWSFPLLLAFALLPCARPASAQSGDGAAGKPIGPVHISSGVMAGQILTKVPPAWPEGVPGVITLHIIIRKDGTVGSVDVLSGKPEFAAAAIEAVKQWTYRPYLLNGEPMEVDTTVTLDVQSNAASGATDSGPASNTSDIPPPVRQARIAGGVMAGRLIQGGHLVYPKDARIAGVGGTVVMKAIIGKDGTIKDLTVVSGPDMLQSAATDAVKQWIYKPYLLNGEPTEVNTTITVNFNLNPPPQTPSSQNPPPQN